VSVHSAAANSTKPLNLTRTNFLGQKMPCRATAVEYYELAGNTAEIIECFYHLEEYKKLESFIQVLPEGDPLLKKIGDMFAANAVISEAVQAYCKVIKTTI
jgi:hypothetical protein